MSFDRLAASQACLVSARRTTADAVRATKNSEQTLVGVSKQLGQLRRKAKERGVFRVLTSTVNNEPPSLSESIAFFDGIVK